MIKVSRLRKSFNGQPVLKGIDLDVPDGSITIIIGRSGGGKSVFLKHLPIVDGSVKGWLADLPELAKIPAERVVPGHGPLTAPWPAALDAERSYFERLVGDVKAEIAKGDDVSDAARDAARTERERWSLFNDYNPRNATAAFAEYEWDTP